MKIVFMGTPNFAVQSLKALVKAGHVIEAVYTQPDKPFGRKQILKCSEVKLFAQKFNLLIRQPEKFNENEVEFLKKINPDLIIVVAYSKFLPSNILKIPKFGCINIHASLLPQYRGASPIQASIMNCDEFTGVSAIFLTEKLDAGDIIGQLKIKIHENDTAEIMFDKLANLGAILICDVLVKLENKTLIKIKQDENEATYAPVLKKNIGKINFNESALKIHKLICGLNKWPVAFCFLNNKMLKIYCSCMVKEQIELKPAQIIKNGNRFIVGCGKGAVEFLQVHLEGRKKVDGASFMNGLKNYEQEIFLS